MHKQWSLKQVAIAHNYITNSKLNCPHHEFFYNWLKNQNIKTVFDIGCCSGIVLYHIETTVNKYYGVDLCSDNIEYAKNNWKDEKFIFKTLDVELEEIPIKFQEYDICYMDSTLTMMEEPSKLLIKLHPYFNCIFLNRTNLYQNCEKTKIKWDGMEQESTLWKFCSNFFHELDSYFEIQTTETNAIILRKKDKA